MPVPPAPALRESLTGGDIGHIADHEAIHSALNNDTASLSADQTVSGVTTFLAGKFLDAGSVIIDIRAKGAACDGVTDDAAAINDGIADAAAAGGGIVFIPGLAVAFDSQIVTAGNVAVMCAPGAVLKPLSDFDLVLFKPEAQWVGGRLDTRDITFTSTVFDIDGAASPFFALTITSLIDRVELFGDFGVGTGTAFDLHATTANSRIIGVVINEPRITGFEKGFRLRQNIGDNTRFVNDNRIINPWGYATVNFIEYVNTGTAGDHIGSNMFENASYQTHGTHSKLVLLLDGSNANIDLLIVDWNLTGNIQAVQINVGSRRNILRLDGDIFDNNEIIDDTSDPGIIIDQRNGVLRFNGIQPIGDYDNIDITDLHVHFTNAHGIKSKLADGVTNTVTLFQVNASNQLQIRHTTADIVYDAAGATLQHQMRINGAAKFLVLANGNIAFRAATGSNGTFTHAITGTRTWTFPDATGTALVETNTDALGGGAAPTLGTIGGSGPATAAQNSWARVRLIDGSTAWLPVWK